MGLRLCFYLPSCSLRATVNGWISIVRQGTYIILQPWGERLRVLSVLALCLLLLHAGSTVICNDGNNSHPVNALVHSIEKAEAGVLQHPCGDAVLAGSGHCVDQYETSSYVPANSRASIPIPVITTLRWLMPILERREIVSRFIPFLRASPSTHLEAHRTIVILA